MSTPEEKAALRKQLETDYGQVWDTDQLREEFTVDSFCAPCVIVIRKRDNKKGTLEFTHMPRFYFAFIASDGGDV